jgi:hypothetical protein
VTLNDLHNQFCFKTRERSWVALSRISLTKRTWKVRQDVTVDSTSSANPFANPFGNVGQYFVVAGGQVIAYISFKTAHGVMLKHGATKP